jgi:hypothetical protein
MGNTEIAEAIRIALNPPEFRTWLVEHATDVVGFGSNAVACPVSRYLDETLLWERWLYASSFDRISAIEPKPGHSPQDADVDFGDRQVVVQIETPRWAYDFILNLDGRTALHTEVTGAQALEVLDEITEEFDGADE